MYPRFNKVLALTVLLSAFSTAALAGNNNGNNGNGGNNDNNSNSSSNSSSNSAAAALAGASATAGAIGLGGKGGNGTGGNASNDGVEFNDRLQIPNAPGLSSGSSNTTSKHRIYQQRQFSTPVYGKTNIDMILDIVSFVGSNPTPDEELAACIQSEDYRTFRKLKEDECPKF